MKRTKHNTNTTTQCNQYPITPDQQLFVNQLLQDKDPVIAMQKLNLIPIDATKKEITKTKEQYLRNISVQEALKRGIQDKVTRLKTTEDAVIAQISRFAFVNPSDLYDDTGNLKPIKELPYELACCINQIKTKVLFSRTGKAIGRTIDVKLNSQLDSLKTLLEKVIFKEPATPVNQFNVNNLNIQHTQTQNNLRIDPKALTKEQVQTLLQLKGYTQTALGFQPNQSTETQGAI